MGFERPSSLSNVGFRTIRSFTLKTINEVGLFVFMWLIFNVHKSTAKFIHQLKAGRYTTGIKGIVYSFRESSAVWDGHQRPRLFVSEVGLMVAVPLMYLFDFLACSNAVRITAVLQDPLM